MLDHAKTLVLTPPVIAREQRQSSAPRPFGPSTDVSGMLDRPVKPGDDPSEGEPSPLLLRLPLLDRAAGIAPGRKAAADMRHRLQSHVLCGLRRERRAQAAGAMEDELLVPLEH